MYEWSCVAAEGNAMLVSVYVVVVGEFTMRYLCNRDVDCALSELIRLSDVDLMDGRRGGLVVDLSFVALPPFV